MIDSICLCCGKKMREEGSLFEAFYISDVICGQCRETMNYYPKRIKFAGFQIEGLYPYRRKCRDLMIQYKEYGDEAIYPAFIYPHMKRLRKKYQGYVLVPMPSSSKALAQRGFKQVIELFDILGLPYREVLVKNNDIDQKQLNYQERQKISTAMELIHPKEIEGKNVLLVDDILTSGATIKAGYHLVKDYAREVKGLVICYNERYLNNFDRWYLADFK